MVPTEREGHGPHIFPTPRKKGDFVKGFSEPWSKVEGWKKGGKKSVVFVENFWKMMEKCEKSSGHL